MAMFGKSSYSTVNYDDDKKAGKADKKKSILNMPISTNIQYNKNNEPDGTMPVRFVDEFDPFDSFAVGTRVEVSADGHLVIAGDTSQIVEESVEEVTRAVEQEIANQEVSNAMPQFERDPFEAPFGAMASGVSLGGVSQASETVSNEPQEAPAEEIPVMPKVETVPVAPVFEPVKEVPVQMVQPQVMPVQQAPVSVQATIPEGFSKEVSDNVSVAVTEAVSKAVSANLSETLVSKIAAEVTKNMPSGTGLTDSEVSKIANEVTKNMPTTSGDGEVRVVTPQVSKEVLDEVVKEVTESVTNSIKNQITQDLLGRLQEYNALLSQHMNDSIVSAKSDITSGVTAGVAASMTSMATGVNEMADKLDRSISNKINDATTKVEAAIIQNVQGIKPETPEELIKGIRDIQAELSLVKQIVGKPEEELPPSQMELKIQEEVEKQKKIMYNHTVIPLLRSFIEERENILRMAKTYKEKGTDIPVGIFSGYAIDLRDILESHKVTTYQVAKGDEYDSTIHKLLSKVVANKEEQNNTIAGVQTDGYRYNDEVIFPAKVEVYNYR